MPNIQSAKKKVRKDRKRTARNQAIEKLLVKSLKAVHKKASDASAVGKAYAIIDKAAKKRIIHKNKAARLKSKVSRFVT